MSEINLSIRQVQLTCSFCQENPPNQGWTYVDKHGSEWIICGKPTKQLVLDGPSWNVTVRCDRLRGPINPPLTLTRKPQLQEIRDAKEQIQELGVKRVLVAPENQFLMIYKEDCVGIDVPKSVEGIPVVFIDELAAAMVPPTTRKGSGDYSK